MDSAAVGYNKPKVLVTTTTLPRCAQDPEPRFVLDLSKQLQRWFDITILAPAHPGALLSEQLEGVRVVRYRYAPLRSQEILTYPGAILTRLRANLLYWALVPLLLRGLRKATRELLRAEEFDCVHCHWLLPQGLVQAFSFTKPGSPPFVVTSHGSDAFTLNGRLFRGFKKLVLERASAITVVSNSLRRRFVSEPGLAEIEDTIHVVPMGTDFARFSPDLRDPSWAEKTGLRAPVVLFVGRLDEQKGVQYLLRALSEPSLLGAEFSAAIIGDGPMRASLHAQVQRDGLGDRVRFLGAMGHDRLRIAYASADIICAPSIVREGVPTVLIEAAASGLPAVASKVGGIPEIIVDGKTGLLVAERDPSALAGALHELISDQKLRRRLGRRAQEHAGKFDWKVIGESFASVIESAIDGKSDRGAICRNMTKS